VRFYTEENLGAGFIRNQTLWIAFVMNMYLYSFERFVNSPPGQLTAGVTLAAIVWKFFERVEAVLTEQTKFEIAVWLVSVNTTGTLRSWPDTFARVFDRVFGTRHFTWRCFCRSCLMSLSIAALAWLLAFAVFRSVPSFVVSEVLEVNYDYRGRLRVFTVDGFLSVLLTIVILNAIPDYIALLKTRRLLRHLATSKSILRLGSVLILDATLSLAISAAPMWVASSRLVDYNWKTVIGMADRMGRDHDFVFASYMDELRKCCTRDPAEGGAIVSYLESRRRGEILGRWKAWLRLAYVTGGRELVYVIVLPSFFASVWLWLYAGAGFLLKAGQRIDIGFDWISRRLNIEEKPLQAIGLVSGAMVALAYWGVLLVARVLN
jgi:hypothetical protein